MRMGGTKFLWLFLLVPFVITLMILAYRSKIVALKKFAPGAKAESEETAKWGWEEISKNLSLVRKATKSTIMVCALIFLIGAMARPQYGGTEKMLKVKGIDIALAIDFSKSMLARDIRPDRITRAKKEIEELLGKLTGDRVAVVPFAGTAISYPLTTDYGAIGLFLRDIKPYDMPLGGTNIGAAIESATKLLTSDPSSKGRSKVIVLLTDGEDHEGQGVEAAKEAAKHGIKIIVLGIGTGTAELVPKYLEDGTQDGFQQDVDGKYVTTSLSPENEEKLKEIARDTKGIYIRSAPGKINIFPVIEEIRRMKQEEIKARKVTIYDEFYIWLLLPAFLLLLVECLISDSSEGIIKYLWRRRRRRSS
jgi:Ca-activated chloride channel family protein